MSIYLCIGLCFLTFVITSITVNYLNRKYVRNKFLKKKLTDDELLVINDDFEMNLMHKPIYIIDEYSRKYNTKYITGIHKFVDNYKKTKLLIHLNYEPTTIDIFTRYKYGYENYKSSMLYYKNNEKTGRVFEVKELNGDKCLKLNDYKYKFFLTEEDANSYISDLYRKEAEDLLVKSDRALDKSNEILETK